MRTTTDVESLLVPLVEILIDEVRGLRADLRRDRPTTSTLSRGDRERMAAILPAAAGVLGSEQFNSADICESDEPALRLVSKGLNSRQLGRLLRRAAGRPIDGYMVQREGSAAGVALWRIFEVPGFSGNKKVLVPGNCRVAPR